MLLIVHISLAAASVLFSLYTALIPSTAKLKIIYGLTAAVIISGSLLIFSTGQNILSTCVSGLIYLGLMAISIKFVRYRLRSA